MKNILTLMLVLLALFPAALRAQTTPLKPGDPVEIELKTPAEDAMVVSAKYTVSPSGTIKVPHLEREIQAAGITAADLARRIEAEYRRAEIYTTPTIVANINNPKEQATHVVNVAGEVKSSNTIPLREGMRLLAAVSACGGFTEFAKVKGVRLIRGNKDMVYDMRKIDPRGSNNPVLQDGDSIIVPQD